VRAALVCAQGRRAAQHAAVAERRGESGICHAPDPRDHDVAHDRPSWRAQIAHHLPRFC
jgi:hypothetical protein